MSDILKIQISADTKQAEVALESTQKKLAGVAAAAVKADSSLDGLAKSVAPAAAGINKAGAASGGASQKIGALASSVSQSVSGFEELGALANVAELGLAGLGAVAISAAIAFVEYVTKLSNAAQAQRDLSISLNESAASVQGNVARLTLLVDIAKDVTKSDSERKEALGALNKEYDGFNKSLTLANINTEASIDLIRKQTNAIVRQAQIKGLENLITKESEKQADLVNTKIEDRLTLFDKLKSLGSFDAFSATVKASSDNLNSGLKDSNERIEIFTTQLKNLLSEDAFEGTLFSEKTTKEKTQHIKKAVESISDVLAKLARSIALLNQQEINLGTDEAKAKISAIEQTIQRLVKDFKVDPKDTIIQKLFGDIRLIKGTEFEKDIKMQARRLRLEPVALPVEPLVVGGGNFNPFGSAGPAIQTSAKSFQKDMEDAVKRLNFLGVKTGIQDGIRTSVSGLRFPELNNLLESAEGQLKAFNDSASKIIGETIGNLAVATGEALGNAINGDGKGLFGAFFDILGSGLQALGTKMIALSGILQAIQIALKKLNPAFLLVGGIAAVAIGTAFKNISIPGFAGGVDNFRGGLAVVGERGPELVNLPRGSDVIPNHRLNGMAGSDGMQVFIPETRIAGADIVISYNRASSRNSRNGF